MPNRNIAFPGHYVAAMCLLWFGAATATAGPAPCTPNTLNNLGAGCEQLNLIFTNLGLSNSNGPNASLIPTTFAGASETAGVTTTFLSGWIATDLGSPANTHATLSFNVAVDPSIPPPDPGQFWAITGLSLSEAGAAVVGPGASVQIVESFCLGSSTFNCTPTSGNYGFIEYQLVRVSVGNATTTDSICFNDGNSSCTVTHGSLTLNLTGPGSVYPLGVQQIAVQDVLALNAPNILRTASLNNVGNGFIQAEQVPEPATFSVMGIALAGLAVIVYRRRRLIQASDQLLDRDRHSGRT